MCITAFTLADEVRTCCNTSTRLPFSSSPLRQQAGCKLHVSDILLCADSLLHLFPFLHKGENLHKPLTHQFEKSQLPLVCVKVSFAYSFVFSRWIALKGAGGTAGKTWAHEAHGENKKGLR